MGCSESKEGGKHPARRPSAVHSDPMASPRPGERVMMDTPEPAQNGRPETNPQTPWTKGAEFPVLLADAAVTNPEDDMKGIELVNCTVSEARVHCLEGCTLTQCTVVDSYVYNCTLRECEVKNCIVAGGEIKDTTLTDSCEVKDCHIDRCIVSNGCTVTSCTVGRTLTTIGSTYKDCTGCPEPAPAVSDCQNCTWEPRSRRG